MFGQKRAGEFLQSLLNASTVTRYRARAAFFFEIWCQIHLWNWDAWPEEDQNIALADFEGCYDEGNVHGCSLPSLLIGILLEFCGMLDIVEALNGSDHLRFAGAIADHDSRQMGKWEVVQIAAALFANSQGNCSCEPPTCGRRFFDLVADIPTGSKGSVEVS